MEKLGQRKNEVANLRKLQGGNLRPIKDFGLAGGGTSMTNLD